MGAQLAGTPVLCGSVPPIAYPYHQRPETGAGLTDGLRPGETTILTSGDPSDIAGLGACGTGKTQLAIAFTHVVWNARAVDLLVWVPGASRQAIVTAFAQAVGAVDTDIQGETAQAAAQRFLAWLSRTTRRWAVVIDDLRDSADLADLWPAGPAGQTIVTTRLPGDQLAALGRQVVQVDAYTSREALAYLNARFVAQPDQRIEALDLAEDLGRLPLALSLAANYIADRDESCRDYRPRYAERYEQVKAAATAECPANVLAAWSLAIEWAHELDPANLAWPAVALAAMGDDNGIPSPVLSSHAACEYITGRPSATGAADQNMVRAVFDNLARLGLVSVDTVSAARAITMHSAFRLAVLRYLPPADIEQVVTAAAAAILETWPDQVFDPQLDQALRDSTTSLQAFAGDLLWKPEAHPLLFRAGRSLEGALLAESAISFWQEMTDTATRLLGPGHMQAVQSRDRLAAAYEAAGRLGDATAVFESALADRELNLGADHPDTLTTRLNMAHSYQAAGHGDEATGMYEQALADRERALGPDHPDTLAARANLAYAYRTGGRLNEAIPLYEQTLEGRERAQGPQHRDTLTARGNLAAAYHLARRWPDAITQYERAVADSERTLGPGDIDTLTTRCNLATAYYSAGALAEAVTVLERALADCEHFLGPHDPMTNTVRENLRGASRE